MNQPGVPRRCHLRNGYFVNCDKCGYAICTCCYHIRMIYKKKEYRICVLCYNEKYIIPFK